MPKPEVPTCSEADLRAVLCAYDEAISSGRLKHSQQTSPDPRDILGDAGADEMYRRYHQHYDGLKKEWSHRSSLLHCMNPLRMSMRTRHYIPNDRFLRPEFFDWMKEVNMKLPAYYEEKYTREPYCWYAPTLDLRWHEGKLWQVWRRRPNAPLKANVEEILILIEGECPLADIERRINALEQRISEGNGTIKEQPRDAAGHVHCGEE